MKHKVTILQEHEFTPAEIGDLLTTAFEGGINYWCGRVVKLIDKKTNKYAGVSDEDQEKIQYASDLIGYNGRLRLHDIEDPTEKWTLTLEKMLKGISMYCKEYKVALNELIDNHDAETADLILQYALFDQIVFS